ncbi:hypothetical protein FRB95_008445 [Tulasnella sp. JGI-2019a]|nr:hypothetical protein FRB93_011438 [Tulasnella sp. JGI-2019a]KAG9036611.1 hypothetical protein FRB95_008445 [Tulasnella sp. JGI-2019a]
MPPNASSASLLNALAGQSHLPVTQLFHKGEVVGKGAYGSVHRGIHIGSRAVVALKIINLDIADDDVEAIQKEVALLSQLRGGESTNVTQYYGCWLDGPRVWIVMDFASGGSVRTLMKATKGGVVEERHTVVIVREVLVALSFLHKAGVIHRDIKAANVLITSQGRVVLCDFGVSALLATTHSKRATMVGTPYWMAPEVISGSLYDTKADIWSLGVTIYEMMMKTPPHSDQVPMRAFILITTGPTPKLPENTGSKEIKDFMAMCLKELPADRLTADELAKAKWIKNSSKVPITLLKELLVKYTGWVQQGGVRDSIVADTTDFERQSFDAEHDGSWEFDTIRGQSDPDSSSGVPGTSIMSSSPATPAVPGPGYQAPRSLRMLFEDSSVPPPLSESFLRNNLGSSRSHAPQGHGQGPSMGAATSAPTGNPLLTPSSSGEPYDLGSFTAGNISQEDVGLTTARQPNFSRLAAPRDEYDDATARAPPPKAGSHTPKSSASGVSRRSPSPMRDLRSSPTPPLNGKMAGNYKDIRNVKGVADLALSSSSNTSTAPSTPGVEGMASGRVTPSSANEIPQQQLQLLQQRGLETPSRPSTALSSVEEVSPKSTQPRARNVASPLNFQFPPLSNANAKPGASGKKTVPAATVLDFATPSRFPASAPSSASSLSRPHTSSGTSTVTPTALGSSSGLRDNSALINKGTVTPTMGLTPPKPVGHHPTSRSMDSARGGTPSSSGHNPSNLGLGSGLGAPLSVGVGGQHGSVSDSEALNGHVDATSTPRRTTPGRLFAVRRQASMEMGSFSASTLDRNGSTTPLQASTHQLGGNLSNVDLLPPSPSFTTPARYGLGLQPSTSASEANGIGSNGGGLQAPSYASSSQTSSTSTTSASTSISSTTSISTLYGPPVRSFDYGMLLTADDVHGELAKVVEDLATWLGIVESGLSTVLESVVASSSSGVNGVNGHGGGMNGTGGGKYAIGPDISVSEGEGEGEMFDDSMDQYSGVDEEDGADVNYGHRL